MRTLSGSLSLAVAFLALGALPAHAGSWSCDGPAYICSSGQQTAPASASKTSKRTANKASKRKSYAYSESHGSNSFSGKASYYWEPQALASGGRFNPNALTAAHKTLPFGTKVRVTNKYNGESVVVTINDRGPYIAGRVIDLSKAAAKAISMTGAGVVPVSVTVLGKG